MKPPPGETQIALDATPYGFKGDVYLCSDVYADDKYEYFHMHIPHAITKYMDVDYKLSSKELALLLGVRVQDGWEHYTHCRAEPHVIPMRRPRPLDSPYRDRYASMLAAEEIAAAQAAAAQAAAAQAAAAQAATAQAAAAQAAAAQAAAAQAATAQVATAQAAAAQAAAAQAAAARDIVAAAATNKHFKTAAATDDVFRANRTVLGSVQAAPVPINAMVKRKPVA